MSSKMVYSVVNDSVVVTEVISKDQPTRPKEVDSSGGSTPEVASKIKDSEGKVTKKAQRDYIETESSLLTGSLTLREAKPSIKSKSNIDLQGLGGVLSGLYYVEKSIFLFDSQGLSHTLDVSRKGFGNSMMTKKEVQVPSKPVQEIPREVKRPKVVPKIVRRGGGGNANITMSMD